MCALLLLLLLLSFFQFYLQRSCTAPSVCKLFITNHLRINLVQIFAMAHHLVRSSLFIPFSLLWSSLSVYIRFFSSLFFNVFFLFRSLSLSRSVVYAPICMPFRYKEKGWKKMISMYISSWLTLSSKVFVWDVELNCWFHSVDVNVALS